MTEQEMCNLVLNHSLLRSVNELKNLVRFSTAFGELSEIITLEDAYELAAYRLLAHGLLSTIYHLECQLFVDFEDTDLAHSLVPIIQFRPYSVKDVRVVHSATVAMLAKLRGHGQVEVCSLKDESSGKLFYGVSSRHHNKCSGSMFMCDNILQAATYIVGPSSPDTIKRVSAEVLNRFGLQLSPTPFILRPNQSWDIASDFLWTYKPERVVVPSTGMITTLSFVHPWSQIVQQVKDGAFSDWSWPPMDIDGEAVSGRSWVKLVSMPSGNGSINTGRRVNRMSL